MILSLFRHRSDEGFVVGEGGFVAGANKLRQGDDLRGVLGDVPASEYGLAFFHRDGLAVAVRAVLGDGDVHLNFRAGLAAEQIAVN